MAKKSRPAPEDQSALPSREAILAFIAESPGKVGKRDIARHFGIKGGDRVALKERLAEMDEEGVLDRRGKALQRRGTLPSVLVLVVIDRDEDGELIAEPASWDADERGKPPKIRLEAGRPATRGRHRPPGPAAGVGSRVLARIVERAAENGLPLARIIKVIDRTPAETLAVVRKTASGARLMPIDRKQREILIDGHDLGEAEDGDLVRLAVSGRGRYGQRARILENLGDVSSEKTVSMIAIHAHGIPHVFPEDALVEAAEAVPAGLKGREDWRALPLVTIDPPDARDHDDAVHAEPDPSPDNEGGFIVTVAIADVAHYVQRGSALDAEALKRGNSVYFPDRVVPMLPERISNDLCSLIEGEDRAAMAVRIVFRADGRKKSHSFHRVLMRSAAKLAYGQAQDAIDGRPDDATGPLLDPVLRPLWDAYACLKRARDAREPLDLDLPERKINLAEDGAIESVSVRERFDAHRLIEEFMIQANVAAAETCEKAGVPLVYRIHDAPSLEKLEALREFLKSIDINLPRTGNLRPSTFNRVLAKVAGSEHEHLVNEVVLRSQSQAEYAPTNIGHFGLNLRRYAHFTSPIRRYADLVVHRALIRAENLGDDGLRPEDEERLATVATMISQAERRAMAAERDTVDRLVAMWLGSQVGGRFHGRLSGVTGAGLFVALDETGADGFIPASSLGDDYYRYHEGVHALIGDRHGEMFRLGDRVEVMLVEAAPLQGGLRFEIVAHKPSKAPSGRAASRGDRDVARKGGRRAPARGKPGRGGRIGRKNRS